MCAVWGFKIAFGGQRSTGFGVIYDNLNSAKKSLAKHLLIKEGVLTKKSEDFSPCKYVGSLNLLQCFDFSVTSLCSENFSLSRFSCLPSPKSTLAYQPCDLRSFFWVAHVHCRMSDCYIVTIGWNTPQHITLRESHFVHLVSLRACSRGVASCTSHDSHIQTAKIYMEVFPFCVLLCCSDINRPDVCLSGMRPGKLYTAKQATHHSINGSTLPLPCCKRCVRSERYSRLSSFHWLPLACFWRIFILV